MPNDAPLDELKAELDKLAAENLALQVVVQFLFKSLGDANPALRPLLLKIFDDAANFTERMRANLTGTANSGPDRRRYEPRTSRP